MNTTEQKLREAIAQMNESAEEKWQNERIIGLDKFKETEEGYEMEISLGKFEPTYHDVVVTPEGWRIKRQSYRNRILNDVMQYVVVPELFGNL